MGNIAEKKKQPWNTLPEVYCTLKWTELTIHADLIPYWDQVPNPSQQPKTERQRLRLIRTSLPHLLPIQLYPTERKHEDMFDKLTVQGSDCVG